jgi:LacI family transcriptional regulator
MGARLVLASRGAARSDIVGFDDIALGDLLRFPVTTVAQDVEAIGREAFKILMDVREGQASPGEVLVPPGLVVR